MNHIFVRDSDSTTSGSNIWNKPLEKVTPPTPPTPPKPEYIPTNTPGIVQNTRTGKLETNLPDPSQQ